MDHLQELADAFGLSLDDVALAIYETPELRDCFAEIASAYFSFVPRPDRPDLFDQQASFVNARDKISFFIAGNGCLAGDEPLYDPLDGSTRPISERSQPFYVWSRAGDGRRTIGLAGPAYRKGTERLYRVSLSNGRSFVCTAWHRLLAIGGAYLPLAACRVGSRLLSLPQQQSALFRHPSIPGFCHSKSRQDAGHSFRTPANYPGCYSPDRRLCDAQLPSALAAGREVVRQLADALARNRTHWPLDGLVSKSGRSQLCRAFARPSKNHFWPRSLLSFAAQTPDVCKTNSASFGSGDTRGLSASSSTVAIHPTRECRQSPAEFFRTHTTPEFQLPATDSAWLPLVNLPCAGNDVAIACEITCIAELSQGDYWDISVWPWNNYELAGVVHHNSGKTEAAAYKCAQFLLNGQPPPRQDTPYWILSKTMDLVTNVCWKEKLLGNGHIPYAEIDWGRVTWHDKKALQPKTVPLKPWPEHLGGKPGANWTIEFKSFEMGREALQGASIGGFWYSEQFPVDLFTETVVRCRDYLYRGGQFCEFTPLEPDLCIWIEKLLEDAPADWGFYRGNTEQNRTNLAEGAIEAFMATVPDELVETRLRGALATFEGAIYPGFSTAVHVVDESLLQRIPPGCWHALGTDWGSSVEHPHVTLWGCIDGLGDWWIYDEFWSIDQTLTTYDRAQEIVARCASWGWPTAYGTAHGRQFLKCAAVDPHFGVNFADPSRPGEINDFSVYGVPTAPAMNRVYDGINIVRSLLKVVPNTGRPRLHISKRCKHLIDEIRKYRWRRARRPTEGDYLNPAVAAPQPLKRDDDCPDALRYLIATYNRNRFAQDAKPARNVDTPQRKSVQLTGRGSGGVASRGAAAIFRQTR